MKAVLSLALRTSRFYLQEIPLIRPQAIVLPGIKTMKNPNDPIGNRTRDLQACNAVPQPTAPPRDPPRNVVNERNLDFHGALKCFSSHSHILCCSMYCFVSLMCCSTYCLFVLFYVWFVCKCVLYYCHRLSTQLQLNISYHNISYHIISYCSCM